MTDVFRQLNVLWHVVIPAWVGQVFRSLGDRLTDGVYLARWRVASALATPFAFFIGLVLPLLHEGPAITVSRILMAVVAAVGVVSLGCGGALTFGYAVGFYLWGGTVRARGLSAIEGWLSGPGTYVYSVLLVWMLAMVIGAVTLGVRVDVRQRGWEERLGPAPMAVATVLTVGLTTYFVTKAMPLLVRPIYVWKGRSPDADAVVPVQEDWWIVVAAALFAISVRLLLERRAESGFVIELIIQVTDRLKQPGRTIPGWLRTTGTALAVLFLLSSLFENYLQAAGTFVVILLMLAGRPWLGRQRLIRSLAAVPLLLRYGLAIIGSRFAIDLILSTQASNERFRTDSFLVALIAVLVSLGLFLIATAPQAGQIADSSPAPAERGAS